MHDQTRKDWSNCPRIGWPGEVSLAFVMQTATIAGSSAAQSPPTERANGPRIHGETLLGSLEEV